MKGFFKRDVYFLMINGKFYFCFMAAMAILAVFTDFSSSFLYLYATIFCASSVVTLFNYDEANHWTAYAASVPNGRRAQVDARYLVGLLVSAVAAALMLLVSLFSKEEGGWVMALLYGGMGLVYLAVACPLQYHFGARSRMVMIILIAALAGLFGALGGAGIIAGTASGGRSLLAVALPLAALSLAALFISHRISLHIVGRKEY